MFSFGVLGQAPLPAARGQRIPGTALPSWFTLHPFSCHVAVVAAQRAQAEAPNTGWKGRAGHLPQPPLASGVLTLIVQSFSHSRVAAPQSLPFHPALLLQHLPAKALGEEKNVRVGGQSPSASPRTLLLQDPHPLNTAPTAQSSPWCISQRCRFAALKQSRPPSHPGASAPTTSGPSPEHPYLLHLRREKQESEQHGSGKLFAALISPRAAHNEEAEPVLFGNSHSQMRKNVVSSALTSWTLSKDDRAKVFPTSKILQGQNFPTSPFS